MIPDGNESARGLPYHRDDTTRNRLRRRYRPWFTCFWNRKKWWPLRNLITHPVRRSP